MGKGGWGKGSWGNVDPWTMKMMAQMMAKGKGKGKKKRDGDMAIKDDFVVDENARYQGRVTHYVKWSGFGFLEMTQKGVVPGDKVFCHWRSLDTADRYASLTQDLDVEFGLQKYKDRWTGDYSLCAKNVTLPGGGKIALQDEQDAEKKSFVGSQTHRFSGTLKFYNQAWGYGYITRNKEDTFGEEVPDEIRVEQPEVNTGGAQVPSLKEMKVEFGIWKTKKDQYKAYNLTLPGGQPLKQEVMENRKQVDRKEYAGTVAVWNYNQGWGMIKSESKFPKQIMTKLEEMRKGAQERNTKDEWKKNKGRTADDLLFYFRKADIRKDSRIQLDAAVKFQAYTDDKGAGAMDIH